ncbi:MAG TPA: hypothetical protein VF701_21265 [Thermoanaerobaculia bacterium]
MFRSWRALSPLLVVGFLIVLASPAEGGTRVVKMDAMKDPFYGVISRLALLQVDDGGAQTLVLRHVYNSGFKVVPGARAGGEAIIDLRKVSGQEGSFVDVMVSSIALPGSVLLLHENGSIVELRGVWGNGNIGVWGNGNIGVWGNGNIGIWGNGNLGVWGNGNIGVWGNGNIGLTGPENIRMHGPFFSTEACGSATSFGEGVRHFFDPLEGFFDPLEGFFDPLEGYHDPLVGIGTEGGCVGFAGLDIPQDWFDASVTKSVDEWLDKGLVATGGPLVKVSSSRVDDVVLMPMAKNWIPNINQWMPKPDDWLDASGGTWFPDLNDWIPNVNEWMTAPHDWVPDVTEWIPDPNEWYELAALSDGQIHGIHPGRRSSIETPGVPGFRTFSIDASSLGENLSGLASPRMPTSFTSPSIAIPIGDMFEWPLTVAGRTGSVGITGIESGLALKTGSFLKEVCSTCSIKSINLGSMWGVTEDGDVLFAPDFNPVSGELGFNGVLNLGSPLTVDLGPSSINLKSRGDAYTASIEASGDGVLQIDPSSVQLTIVEDGGSPLTSETITLEDDDGDGNRELIVKFSRKELISRLVPLAGTTVTLELSWAYAGNDCTVSDDDETPIPCTGSFAKEVKIVR